jgi:hypothetical protein
MAFYKRLGAEPVTDWTVYRLEHDSLEQLAKLGDPEGP